MIHSQADYLNAGYHYEKRRKTEKTLRRMIATEPEAERAEAWRLIERGRAEARLTDES
jgi:hypothetical protein